MAGSIQRSAWKTERSFWPLSLCVQDLSCCSLCHAVFPSVGCLCMQRHTRASAVLPVLVPLPSVLLGALEKAV